MSPLATYANFYYAYKSLIGVLLFQHRPFRSFNIPSSSMLLVSILSAARRVQLLVASLHTVYMPEYFVLWPQCSHLILCCDYVTPFSILTCHASAIRRLLGADDDQIPSPIPKGNNHPRRFKLTQYRYRFNDHHTARANS